MRQPAPGDGFIDDGYALRRLERRKVTKEDVDRVVKAPPDHRTQSARSRAVRADPHRSRAQDQRGGRPRGRAVGCRDRLGCWGEQR